MYKRVFILTVIITMLVSVYAFPSTTKAMQTPSLAAYWKFDDGMEEKAEDSSIHEIHGKLVNNPTWGTQGRIKKDLIFDGKEDYVDTGSSLRKHLNGAHAVTISAWIKNDSIPSEGKSQSIFVNKMDGSKSGLELNLTSNGIQVGGRSAPTEAYVSKTVAYSSVREWHHVVGILDYDNHEIRVYIDGTLMNGKDADKAAAFHGTAYKQGADTTFNDSIGGEPLEKNYFMGEIDEVRVYHEALSQFEVKQLKNDSRNLKGQWTFNKGVGRAIADGSGNSNIGKLRGGASWISNTTDGKAIRFNGTTGYVELGSKLRNDVHGSSAITVTARFKNSGLPGANHKQILYTSMIDSDIPGIEISMKENRLQVGARSKATDSYQSKEVSFGSAGTWHLVVGVLDFANQEIRIYIDGKLQNQDDKKVNFGSTTYIKGNRKSLEDTIGKNPKTNDSYFKGSISDIRVYNIALSDEEIQDFAGLVNPYGVNSLTDGYSTIYKSLPQDGSSSSPMITKTPGGRLVASFTLDGVVKGKVYTSDDEGASWSFRTDLPFKQARTFVAGNNLYAIGQLGDIKIMKSTDWGTTWGPVTNLTTGQSWEASVSSAVYDKGNIYLTMEKRVYTDTVGWDGNALAPVLMRADADQDLTVASNWTFASELAFRDIVTNTNPYMNYFGVPFYDYTGFSSVEVEGSGRMMAPLGWSDANIVQIKDPDNYMYDPNGKTYYLWMRSHTGGAGYANVAKVVENSDGTMTTSLVTFPSGKIALFVPLPGGQLKFNIVYDEATNLYWMVSNQTTDSWTRAEELPSDRYGLPDGERDRLQLFYSRNCIDWIFAGMVAMGPTSTQARNNATMAIVGNDILIVSESGDANAVDAEHGNMITFHKVENYRSLVY